MEEKGCFHPIMLRIIGRRVVNELNLSYSTTTKSEKLALLSS